nr:zinc finger, CCHC-type [Tanacetum cinerariifolium]
KDLDRLWSLVKETCSTTKVTDEKDKELWVELKRLYEPDSRDLPWALQRYMHDPLIQVLGFNKESSSKRAGDKLEQEIAKKQRIEDENESAELKRCLEIVLDAGDDATIDASPLSSNKMLKNFDREDLEVLWRLVKGRFVRTKPVDVKTTFLNGELDEEVYMKQPKGFVMPDMGEDGVIFGIKIQRENKGIVITQSHYIEKILKKFNHEDCSPVSTPMDPVEKLKPNTGKPVDQLEYSRAIGCLIYAMTSTRPDIAYDVGRLSMFTSNPSRQHWKAITRVFKNLRGTKDYGLSYARYPLMLEGYSNATWINYVEDSSSTSGWVFLLGGALAAVGKEAEWLRNLIHEIPIWPKPIAPISIRCDSAPTMPMAYSQIYNGKSTHLGVRHSIVRELIRNGVISIEFVRTQHNLADHLTKGLARDSVQDLKGPPM